jgi:hypothetical protein
MEICYFEIRYRMVFDVDHFATKYDVFPLKISKIMYYSYRFTVTVLFHSGHFEDVNSCLLNRAEKVNGFF